MSSYSIIFELCFLGLQSDGILRGAEEVKPGMVCMKLTVRRQANHSLRSLSITTC